MLCPYCRRPMEAGSLQDSNAIVWLPTTKHVAIGNAWAQDGAVTLAHGSFFKSNAVTAYLCRECKKILIDYAEPDPNFPDNR